jgi:hypothetical protein
MAEKNIQTLHIQKHDIERYWNKVENFIPQQAELIVFDADENYSYERFKIGDGKTPLRDLPFAHGEELATEDEILALLSTQNIVTPMADASGVTYTDENQNILTI